MHSDAMLNADEDARAHALDVSRSFVVQAPAGSGKTALLIQRYLSLLATVEQPEDVLAITFTQKAAEEMRTRVLDALRRAERGETDQRAHESITLHAAQAVLKRSERAGWGLFAAPSRLRIQTLDAFCAGVARTLPLTSGLGASAAVVQDAAALALYRRAALDTLDWLLEDSVVGRAVETVLKHLDNDTQTYVDHLATMLAIRDQWLGIVGSGEIADAQALRATLESNLAGLIEERLRRLRIAMLARSDADIVGLAAYAGERLMDADREHGAAALVGRTELPGAAASELAAWRALAELLLTKGGQWRKTVTERQGFPPRDNGEKKAWLEVLKSLAGDTSLSTALHVTRTYPEPRYDDRQWEMLVALFTVLPVAVAELKRSFAADSVCDFTEVALAAAQALGSAEDPGQAALYLDYRIRHLLVDEMQDTSIGQYRLLETLTAGWQPGDGRTFFCVGDPMQSIYRFRNAEVGQFLGMQERGLADVSLESLTLRRNFRSEEQLVRWVNGVFAGVFPTTADASSGAVTYRESVPVRPNSAAGACRVYALPDASVAREAEEAAALIAQLLADTVDDDVAVLVRSRTQLPALLAELRRRGIDYDAIEIERLTELPEIIDVQALTRACVHPGDRAAWLAVLRGPLVGLDWTDLHRLVAGSDAAPIWDLMHEAERCAGLSSFAQQALERVKPALKTALSADAVQSLRERIETVWFRLGGPGCLDAVDQVANVYRYFDLLEQADLGGTLPDSAELHSLLDDERVSSFGGPGCRVQVMTMHKAKGLQFDHVILPSLGRYAMSSAPPVLSWLTVPSPAGGTDLIVSSVGARYELERDRLHQYIESRRRYAERLELDRLLYVACTRARKSLHLIAHVAWDDARRRLKKPAAASLLRRLWPALEDEFTRACPPADGPAQFEIESEDAWLVPRLRRAAADWQMPAPPPLPGQLDVTRMPSQRDEELPEYRWVGGTARHAGVVIHRWLQHFVEHGRPSRDALASTERRTRAWAATAGVLPADLDAVCARVRRALEAMLSDSRGLWILDGPGHAELPLTGLSAGRITSVVIDRVRIEGARHWIIDYKTGAHEGGGLQQFIAQEVERYSTQLAKYAALYRDYAQTDDVRTALYFPLIQAFREVEL